MKVHTRTGPVAVPGLEKMLHKVPWFLDQVSLYIHNRHVPPDHKSC